MRTAGLVSMLVGWVLAPLLPGVINRTKALFAGRRGQPLLQGYYDLGKLLRKGAVYSRTTTWVFRAGPVVGLAALLVASALVPWGGQTGLVSFPGDFVMLACLLGLTRFVTVLGALDTGSSFEGMGASREVQFSALAEPSLLLALAVVGCRTGATDLSGMLGRLSFSGWWQAGPALAFATVALMIVVLAENARIPVDDPNTHLELTMVHEAMVLDHGGPDLGFILYGAALKLWMLSSLVVGLALPAIPGAAGWNLLVAAGGMLGVAVLIGIIESIMARLRLLLVPQFLVGASALAVVALVLVLR